MRRIKVTVNGTPRSFDVPAWQTLADLLRVDCGLTGTHLGCEQGECGSCSVLLDGAVVNSCVVLAVQADGAAVRTVEDLAADGQLSELQRSFRREHAVQCGFCTPGMLMAVTAMARDAPPGRGRERSAVCAWLAGNLCRCVGYDGQIRAIAGAPERSDGSSVTRLEDDRLLTGRGVFAADIADAYGPGIAHVVFVRSPLPHALVRGIHTAAAAAHPGVLAVLTGADLNDKAGVMRATPMLDSAEPPLPPLADTEVRFAGEPLAMVLAVSRAVAEDAAELVELDLEPKEAAIDPEAAAMPGAALAFSGLTSNVCQELVFPTRPKLRQALESSPHVVRATFRQQRQANAPLENRAIVARRDKDSGALQVFMSTQNPHEARAAICRVTGLPLSAVRVSAPDVGGSFGQKFWAGREELATTLAAHVLQRDVCWIEDRRENLIASSHARADIGTCTFALAEDGCLLGTYLDHVEDTGVYPTGVIGGAGPFVGMMFTGPYRVPMHAFRFRSVRTNTCPRGAYRGPWTFATVAREQMVDEAARAIGMDPLDLRRRNVLTAAELPYSMVTRISIGSVTPAETLEQAAALIGYQEFRAAQRQLLQNQGLLRGIGLALYVEPSSGGTMEPIDSDVAALRFAPDGRVTVRLGTGAHGQGIETTMAQVVAEELGVAVADVVVMQGDTDLTPSGRGTGASGTAVITGGACRVAAAALLDRARQLAAHLLDADADSLIIKGGLIRPAGSDSGYSLAELARIAEQEPGRLPAGHDRELSAHGRYKAPPVTWSNACHAAIVDVDRGSGVVSVLRYVVSDDCGRIINKAVVEGQIAGGVLQGIAGALSEEVRYDASGNPLLGGLADYPLPSFKDAPLIGYGHIETPSPTPGGHKGMGQGGAVGSPPCVFNAVADALALVGARIDRTPLTPQTVLEALIAAGSLSTRRSARR
jgi:aerobic carbon-monoxide dehydrogenase large subunit